MLLFIYFFIFNISYFELYMYKYGNNIVVNIYV